MLLHEKAQAARRLIIKKLAILLVVILFSLVGCTPAEPALSVVLQAPANGGTVSTLSLILSWNSGGGATSYRLQVSGDANFSNLIVDEANLGSPSYTITSGNLKNGQSYYWRVNASKGSETSAWTAYWTFRTPSPTDTITVQATLNGSPWEGVVSYSLSGPQQLFGSSAPQTFKNLSAGTYTLTWDSGGPPQSVPDSITPSPSATLSSGGTLTFTLNFKSYPDSVVVYATLDGEIWHGQVNFSLVGPTTGSGSSVVKVFENLPSGTYTVTHTSGGPPGATLSGISPSPTQTLQPGGLIHFGLNFHTKSPGTIKVKATMDGATWKGKVEYSIKGLEDTSGSSVPDSFSMPDGTYTLIYHTRGPSDARLASITPQPTQTLTEGGSITYTMNFHSEAAGILKVQATLNGQSWKGDLRCSIYGPKEDASYKVPYSFGNLPPGTYTVSYRSGGPVGATLGSISPAPTQTLGADDVLTFTLNFHSEANGTIVVRAYLDGQQWSGPVYYNIRGPVHDSGGSVPETYTDMPPGTYTLIYSSGGPTPAELVDISPGPTQTLTSGGSIYFNMYFESLVTIT